MSTDAEQAPAGPPRHTPDAATAKLRQLLGDRYPQLTPEVHTQVDDLVAQARTWGRNRPNSDAGDTAAA